MRTGFLRSAVISAAAAAVLSTGAGLPATTAAGGRDGARVQPVRRQFNVSARRYAFEPARLQVQQNDIVKISFSAADIPHSFTVDAYRIAKRANPGQTVVFEFHASEPGAFPIYCNLSIDERCQEMHGELVVAAR